MSSYSSTIKKAKQVAAQSAAVKKKRKSTGPSATAPPASSSALKKKQSKLKLEEDYSSGSDSEVDVTTDSQASDEDESEFSEEEEDAEDYTKGGYHPVQVGDKFNEGRYTILRKLGWGHFSTVWLAQDHKFERPVALKIVKSAPHYTETALDEIKLLDKVVSANRSSPERKCVVELLDWFKHRGPHGTHVCMAFEVLGPNLLTLIRQYHHHGIPLTIVKRITKQVLMGLDYLHRECGIIHTDLKPENVLICINISETLRKLGLTPLLNSSSPKSSSTPMDVDRSTPTPGSPASGTSTPITEEALANMTYAQRKKAKYKLKKMGKWNGGAGVTNGAGASTPEPEVAPGQQQQQQQQDVEMRDASAPASPPPASHQAQPSLQQQQQHQMSEAELVQKQLERKIGARDLDPTGSLPDMSSKAGSAAGSTNVSRAGSTEVMDVDGKLTDALGRNLSEVSLNSKGAGGGVVGHAGHATDPVEAAKGKAREKEMDLERKRRRKEEKKERRLREDERIQVKIADLGNACWVDHHFTNDIQTRQYRSPEAILGAKYDRSADMWSLGCMVFELLTGDYLFDPQAGSRYTKDDDHIAQIIELLGNFPKNLALSGKYSGEIFNRKGELRHIHRLRYWKLSDVLHEKYNFPKEEAEAVAEFVLPMIEINPERRATAQEMLRSPWVSDVEIDESDLPPHVHRGFPSKSPAGAVPGQQGNGNGVVGGGGDFDEDYEDEEGDVVEEGRVGVPVEGGVMGVVKGVEEMQGGKGVQVQPAQPLVLIDLNIVV
ncbi:serine/threonine protein kinase, CMGC group [Rhizophlyctis rosea]|nr:serine/threonine protein kinase, CMGC group [Rhizophlyctis rosea]